MIQAGKLDRSIELQREVETVDDYGQKSSAWTTLTTVRTGLKQRTTREFMQGFGENETAATVFLIRYFAGLTTNDRVLFEGEGYDIKEIAEIGRRQGLELRCEVTR